MHDVLGATNCFISVLSMLQAADAELLEEDGARRKWRLDYTARWNFWKVSGVCENRWVGELCHGSIYMAVRDAARDAAKVCHGLAAVAPLVTDLAQACAAGWQEGK